MEIKNFVKHLCCKKNSSDPLEAFSKRIVEKIFGYCSGNDLLAFSLVNKNWYRFIAQSEKCMDRIKIFITEPKIGCYQVFTMNDAMKLIQHGRNYKHISLTCVERFLTTQHKLLLASFRLTSVHLYKHCFRTKMDFINFLGILEPFIEELVLRQVRHGRMMYPISHTNFSFPKLKRLTIINCYTYMYTQPFNELTSLNNLVIGTEALSFHESDHKEFVERVKSIQHLMLKNHDLKYLELFIHQRDFDAMFMDQRFLKRIEFQLHQLYVGKFMQMNDETDEINVVQINNFVDFLKSQANSLTLFYMEKWLGNNVLEYAINDMQLKELTIANLDHVENHDEFFANLCLFTNDTIEKLSIWSLSSHYNDTVVEVLKVCRTLKMLEVRAISQNILDAIVQYNEHLEIIVADFFTAFIPPDRSVLKKLKKMIININCADNFKDLIGGKERYSNFEVVFLNAAKSLKRRWDLNNMSFYRF